MHRIDGRRLKPGGGEKEEPDHEQQGDELHPCGHAVGRAVGVGGTRPAGWPTKGEGLKLSTCKKKKKEKKERKKIGFRPEARMTARVPSKPGLANWPFPPKNMLKSSSALMSDSNPAGCLLCRTRSEPSSRREELLSGPIKSYLLLFSASDRTPKASPITASPSPNESGWPQGKEERRKKRRYS